MRDVGREHQRKKHKATAECEGCDYFKREFCGPNEKFVCMLNKPCLDYANNLDDAFRQWYEFGYVKGYEDCKEGKKGRENMKEGWLCPRCGKVNAPFIAQCDCQKREGVNLNNVDCQHHWECSGANTAGISYTCKNCGATRTGSYNPNINGE